MAIKIVSPVEKLVVNGTGGTLLDVQGSAGQLFSVTDSLTGDLFAVSDISGIPILNVNSSGAVDIDGTLAVDGKLGVGLTPTTVNLEVKSIQDSSFDEGIGIVRSNTSQTGYINMVGGAMNINAPNAVPIKFRDGGNTNLTIGGDGNATFAGTITSANILPISDATYTIGGGSSTLRWNYLYLNNALSITDGNINAGTTFDFNQGANFAGDVTTNGDITLDDNSGASPSLYLKNGDDNFWRIFNGSSLDLTFRVGTVTKFDIDSSGNGAFVGTIAASNLSGTNTGDQTLSSLGALSTTGGTITSSSNYGLIINHSPSLGDFVDALVLRSTTSGQRAQLGFATVDGDGNHHRASIRAYKGSGNYEGVFGIAIRQTDASHTQRLTLTAGGNLSIDGTMSASNLSGSNTGDQTLSSLGAAPLASPALTGTPTAPTAGATVNTTQLATTAFVQTAVSNLVDSSPAALNTLNELAAALGDDASFSTTVNTNIATKLPLAGGTLTGHLTLSNTNAPSNLAELNIGSSGGGETRAIDIIGGWSSNESKSITFTHGSVAGNMVAQINVLYTGSSSKIRWGRFYHGGDSSTYTMELLSTSLTTANLTVSGNIAATNLSGTNTGDQTNISGNAATATQWGTSAGYANFSSTAISSSVGWLFGTTGNGTYAPVAISSVSSLLNLSGTNTGDQTLSSLGGATAAQGTTADAALPKAGGTLTGALTGTSATFAGLVTTKTYKTTSAAISNSYVRVAEIDDIGGMISSTVRVTMTAHGSSHVTTCNAIISVGHSGDILIESSNLAYTQVTLKVESDNNGKWTLSVKSTSANATTYQFDIQGLSNNLTITPLPTSSQTGATLEHTTNFGTNITSIDNGTAGSLQSRFGGNVFFDNVDTNNSNTSALFINTTSKEIEKRALGSNAFNSTAIPSASDILTLLSTNNIVDWTADQGATNIHSGNYTDTNTTYTASTGLTLTGTAFSVTANTYATAAQGTLATNALPKAGGTMTGTTSHGDNVKSTYGTGNDLQIFHNGTNSYIETVSASSGDLYIKALGTNHDLYLQASDDVYIRPQNGENGIKVLGNDSVELYFDNVRKLRTTTEGIIVEGDIKVDSALLSHQENTVDSAALTVAQVAHATYTAAFFDFVIKKGTNVRAGTVYSCHDGTNVEFTETSTVDLGDTSDVSLSVIMSSTNMMFRATTTSDSWIVKSLVRAI